MKFNIPILPWIMFHLKSHLQTLAQVELLLCHHLEVLQFWFSLRSMMHFELVPLLMNLSNFLHMDVQLVNTTVKKTICHWIILFIFKDKLPAFVLVCFCDLCCVLLVSLSILPLKSCPPDCSFIECLEVRWYQSFSFVLFQHCVDYSGSLLSHIKIKTSLYHQITLNFWLGLYGSS